VVGYADGRAAGERERGRGGVDVSSPSSSFVAADGGVVGEAGEGGRRGGVDVSSPSSLAESGAERGGGRGVVDVASSSCGLLLLLEVEVEASARTFRWRIVPVCAFVCVCVFVCGYVSMWSVDGWREGDEGGGGSCLCVCVCVCVCVCGWMEGDGGGRGLGIRSVTLTCEGFSLPQPTSPHTPHTHRDQTLLPLSLSPSLKSVPSPM
jgi:hypothetical protein